MPLPNLFMTANAPGVDVLFGSFEHGFQFRISLDFAGDLQRRWTVNRFERCLRHQLRSDLEPLGVFRNAPHGLVGNRELE